MVLGESTARGLQPAPSLPFPASGSSSSWSGLIYMWLMKFAGLDSELGHPLAPVNFFLAPWNVYSGCIPFWLVLGMGVLGGDIGRHWKGLRVM